MYTSTPWRMSSAATMNSLLLRRLSGLFIPSPSSRMDRLRWLHRLHKAVEQIGAVPRPRVRLGVILDREDRQLPVPKALNGPVVQVHVRDFQAAPLEAGRVHRVAVVLARDVHA